MQKYLDAGLDPTGDWKEGSPLDAAARFGREDLIRVVLEYGFDPNHRDACGNTPLHHAAMYGYLGSARILINAGADVNCKDKRNNTPLSCALYRGHTSVLTLLLDNGATMDNQLEHGGVNHLVSAAANGDQELVKILLEKSNILDDTGSQILNTALARAARSSNVEITKQLLAVGANVDAITVEGKNALHWAALARSESVVAFLLQEGAIPDIPDLSGCTALFWASSVQPSNEKVVELLLQRGVQTEVQNEDGRTPLSIAAMLGFSNITKTLLANGADPTTTDNDGYTPLALATRHGHIHTVLSMLSNGSSSCTSGLYEETPSNKIKVDYKAYIDTPDRLGRTPLFFATLFGYKDIVQNLVRLGTSAADFASSCGRTPLRIACELIQRTTWQGHKTIEFILECLLILSNVTVDVAKVKALPKIDIHGNKYWLCDRCNVFIPYYDSYYNCGVCNDGNFDLCLECVGHGERWLHTSHGLQLLGTVDKDRK
jgi:ankyrin repeat protein